MAEATHYTIVPISLPGSRKKPTQENITVIAYREYAVCPIFLPFPMFYYVYT
jgi:hypothetical protein